MKIKILLVLVSLLFFFACNQSKSFLSPPIEGLNIAMQEFKVDAGLGDTLFYHTGSILLFPSNAFIDKNGNIIKGEVQIKYREFSKPIDFYLSGIPMDYEMEGKTYSFESSGMAEILAYKDGVPVFVNPDSKPEINLISRNNSDSHNIYFLDTITGMWIEKEKSIVTDLSHSNLDFTLSGESDNIEELVEPTKPEKANTLSPVIRIVIDPASFKELMVYDNMKFQIDPKEENFNPNDTIEEWKRVELQKGSEKGLYIVTFSNDKRTVSFSARPVLEGKDFEKALKVFEKNRKAYDKKLNERLLAKKTFEELYRKDSIANSQIYEENKRIVRMNSLIEARNREILKLNEIVEKRNKQNLEYLEKLRKLMIDANLSNEILRGFNIDGFGIWNCDRAISLNYIPIRAIFKDAKGNILDLTNVAVLYKSFNGIIRFPNYNISVVKDASNIILGVFNGRFAYISYEDFNKLNITSETKEQTFIMTVVSEENNNYEYIIKMIGSE